jgi:hypothetical protein
MYQAMDESISSRSDSLIGAFNSVSSNREASMDLRIKRVPCRGKRLPLRRGATTRRFFNHPILPTHLVPF